MHPRTTAYDLFVTCNVHVYKRTSYFGTCMCTAMYKRVGRSWIWWWLINPLLASLINGLIVLKQLCQSQWCMAAAQQQLQEIRLASGWCRAQRPEHTTPAICSQRQMVWGGGYLTCIIMIDITNKTCWWSHLYKCINQSYFSFSLQYIINLNIINYYTIQFDSRISLVKHFKNKNMKQYIDSKKMEEGQTHSTHLPL